MNYEIILAIAIVALILIIYIGSRANFTPVPEWWDLVKHNQVIQHRIIGYNNINTPDNEFRANRAALEQKYLSDNPSMTSIDLYKKIAPELPKLKQKGAVFILKTTDRPFGNDQWLKQVKLTHMRSRDPNLGMGYVKIKNVINIYPTPWLNHDHPDRNYYTLIETDYTIPEHKIIESSQFKLVNDDIPQHLLKDGVLYYTPVNHNVTIYGRRR